MKPIELTVTQENISQGVRASCKKCPIALALLAFDWETYLGLPGLLDVEVTVGDSTIHVSFPKLVKMLRIFTPREATWFIYAFDCSGACCHPATFTLQPVDIE